MRVMKKRGLKKKFQISNIKKRLTYLTHYMGGRGQNKATVFKKFKTLIY